MSNRLAAAGFGLTVALVIAACRSSSPYSTPANAAIGTGIAVAAAGVNRAVTGECWAACRPGTFCDKTTGLCVERATSAGPAVKPAPGGHPAPVVSGVLYAPGHEHEVPPDPTALRKRAPAAVSLPDAGCDPADADGGPISCEMPPPAASQ